jgi:hypothetical protein
MNIIELGVVHHIPLPVTRAEGNSGFRSRLHQQNDRL